jgi:hypothetical protein
MSANPIDLFTAHGGLRDSAVVEGAFHPERRRRARTQVHWPVVLLPGRGADAIETVTQNLSSTGFYCFSPAPLTPGDPVLCRMKVPAYDPNGEEDALALECRVMVMRAEAAADGFFGIACRIEDYRLITAATRTP